MAGPAEYVRDHMHPDDVVLCNDQFQVFHLMGCRGHVDRSSNYIPIGRPFFPATIDDAEGLLRDRRDGTKVIPNRAILEDLFARNDRIWYIVQPGQHFITNSTDVGTFLRENMDVVYEDWDSLVLFKGDNHRPIYMRVQDDQALNGAQGNYLP